MLGSTRAADFVTEGRSLILVGKPERGKTRLPVLTDGCNPPSDCSPHGLIARRSAKAGEMMFSTGGEQSLYRSP